MQVLSQLSYSPISLSTPKFSLTFAILEYKMVGVNKILPKWWNGIHVGLKNR
jgi:hypothetical protein